MFKKKKATKSSPHSLQLEKGSMRQRRPNAAKNELETKIKFASE